MKLTAMRLIALCLVLAVVLSGCCCCIPMPDNMETERPSGSEPTTSFVPSATEDSIHSSEPTDPSGPIEPSEGEEIVRFEDMEYNRQDVDELETRQKTVLDGVDAGDDVETLMEKVFAFYETYHNYYTGYALANIHYSKNMTDSYWEEEYTYCLDTSTQVDSLLDNMLYALAKYPQVEELEVEEYFGEDFFDDYQGESLWDETFTALMDREADLQARYYEIEGEAADVDRYSEAFFSTYGLQLADVYVELIKVRQEIAAYAGYDDYPSFAYDFYFDRDYTPDQADNLMADIKTYLVPLYEKVDYRSLWDVLGSTVSKNQTFLYTKTCARNIGGVLLEAFETMEKGGLYDIDYNNKKYDASFEMYISNYNVPYVFVNPRRDAYDKLTFTHEFGHFANDYASGGSSVGIDVAEFFSQGLEYLSLTYASGGQELTRLKMIDSLCLYVEQTTYAAFEQSVYKLEGSELTRENVMRLFTQTCSDYGLGAVDGRRFVIVPHFFISPVYIISYVVSNDAALQLYQLEQAEKGAGVTKYVENLDTMEGKFLSFVESAGLESPFVDGRVEKVAETFAEVIQ